MLSKRAFIISFFLMAAVLLLCTGCGRAEPEEAVSTPEPTLTPEPVIISMEALEGPTPAPALASPTPEPTPTPTPIPEATEIPFSYYAPTVNMPYEELVGSSLDDFDKSADKLLKDGYPDPKTYYIIVDKYWQVTMIYRRKEDGTKFGQPDYDQPVRYMLCSTGNPKKDYGHETTSGKWQIEPAKVRFYQFVNLEAAQYLTLIHSRTYFHSVLYKKNKQLDTFLPDSYEMLGSKASHACIRLTVPDACWMFYNIGHGTTCEIRDGSKSDERTGAIRSQLVLPPVKSVKLTPGVPAWSDNWSIADRGELTLPYKHMDPRLPDMGDGDDDDDAPDSTPEPFVDPTPETPSEPEPEPAPEGGGNSDIPPEQDVIL